MLTNGQLNLFSSLITNPLSELSTTQIKKISKENSNNALSLAIKKFKKENLVKEKKVGNSRVYSLNFDNETVYNYIGLINSKRFSRLFWEINLVGEEIRKVTPFFSLVLFGSHAAGEETKESDLDIAIFVEDKKTAKSLEPAANSANLSSVKKLDIQIIHRKEMVEMLKTRKDANLGKEIARKHAAILNPRLFYDILREGLENELGI